MSTLANLVRARMSMRKIKQRESEVFLPGTFSYFLILTYFSMAAHSLFIWPFSSTG
jgi:hypothetical protein